MQESQKSDADRREASNQMEIASKDDQPAEKKMKLIG